MSNIYAYRIWRFNQDGITTYYTEAEPYIVLAQASDKSVAYLLVARNGRKLMMLQKLMYGSKIRNNTTVRPSSKPSPNIPRISIDEMMEINN